MTRKIEEPFRNDCNSVQYNIPTIDTTSWVYFVELQYIFLKYTLPHF